MNPFSDKTKITVKAHLALFLLQIKKYLLYLVFLHGN